MKRVTGTGGIFFKSDDPEGAIKGAINGTRASRNCQRLRFAGIVDPERNRIDLWEPPKKQSVIQTIRFELQHPPSYTCSPL